MSPEKLSSRQFGFMAGKSTEDAIVELRRMVDVSNDKYTAVVLFDISGAFDNVWWPLIFDGLQRNGCPKNIYKVILNYFVNRRVKIQWGIEEISKVASKGCPQGSVAGPAFWNLQFDGLLKALENTIGDRFIAYADDLLVLVSASSQKGLAEEAQRVTDLIVEWCDSAKLELSSSKTEAMLAKVNMNAPDGRRNEQTPCPRIRQRQIVNVTQGKKRKSKPTFDREFVIKIGEQRIKFTDSVRYLGVHFDKEMGVTSHCRYINDKVGALAGKLRRVAGFGWGLNFNTLSRLYRSVFVPMMTYAAAGWTDLIRSSDEIILNRAQRRVLISLTSSYRTAPLTGLQVIAGAMPIRIALNERRAAYMLRKGNEVTFNNKVFRPDPERPNSVFRSIEEEAIDVWDAEYQAATYGKTTRVFFKSVIDRICCTSFTTNFYTTQVLTSHGDFNAYLSRFCLRAAEPCDCDEESRDDVEHFLLQREALLGICKGKEWPEAARALV